jgi:predicted RNA-binding protein YlxR (DUF448 family)
MYEMTVGEDRAEGARARRNDAPLRRCIVSGDTLPREMLIRFVVGPDDIVVPDLAGRLPGRGMWLAGRHDIVAQACAKGAFRRAARRAVTPLVGPNGENLAALVDAQLTQRCVDTLGLARRAGQLIVGFDQVRAALKGMAATAGSAGNSAVLLTAQDAAADGSNKLKALANRVTEIGSEVTQLTLFDAKTLGRAIGRDQIVHALLKTDTAGKRLHAALLRLAIYRGVTPLVEVEGADFVSSNVLDMD